MQSGLIKGEGRWSGNKSHLLVAGKFFHIFQHVWENEFTTRDMLPAHTISTLVTDAGDVFADFRSKAIVRNVQGKLACNQVHASTTGFHGHDHGQRCDVIRADIKGRTCTAPPLFESLRPIKNGKHSQVCCPSAEPNSC